MRSEGFPFIVGVWGWTCVRVAFVVSSSPRRRLVVVLSSPRRRVVVNFSLLGGTHALRHHPDLQSMKSGGSLARNALFGGPKSRVVFVFCVTGAILWKRVNASASFFRGRHSTLCSLTRKWGLDEGGGRCVLGGPFFSMAEIGKNWQNLSNNKTTMHVELDIV